MIHHRKQASQSYTFNDIFEVSDARPATASDFCIFADSPHVQLLMDDYYDEEDDKIIRIHPTTGATLTRDIRPLTIAGQIIQVQGWYPADDGDAIFEADGLAVIAKAQNEALQRLAEATGTTVDRLTRDQRRSALTMP